MCRYCPWAIRTDGCSFSCCLTSSCCCFLTFFLTVTARSRKHTQTGWTPFIPFDRKRILIHNFATRVSINNACLRENPIAPRRSSCARPLGRPAWIGLDNELRTRQWPSRGDARHGDISGLEVKANRSRALENRRRYRTVRIVAFSTPPCAVIRQVVTMVFVRRHTDTSFCAVPMRGNVFISVSLPACVHGCFGLVLLASHVARCVRPLCAVRTKPGKHLPERRQPVGGERKGGGEGRHWFQLPAFPRQVCCIRSFTVPLFDPWVGSFAIVFLVLVGVVCGAC